MAVASSLSSAVTFLFPSLLFDRYLNEEDIEFKLSVLSIVISAITAVLFIAVVTFLDDKPKTPPTIAEHRKLSNTFEQPVSLLLRNRNYLLLGTSLIMNYKLGIILTVLLNQMILSVFEDGLYLVTACGLINTLSGIFGVILLPFILDKFKKFKLCLITSYSLILTFFLLVFTCLWYENALILLVAVFLTGLFHAGFSTIAVDTLLELTYPFPESKAYGFIMFVSSVISCILTPLLSAFIETIGVFYAFFVLFIMLIIGLICLTFVKWDLKRFTAEKQPLVSKEDALI
ncbi:feline leukemia virus subgroup C receptor-related protein 2-like protein [Leptotrombidium deliense]|uniref:Feline leukemia virus subgroup C receptor-related protein 2-like protein n=1 Tax=Leptotrombidium deliense TaxID=299467 RepID=A0A443SMZ4_9ACAR|nr:feline leukemia virus subgroup C receptor-related protein 2-like protein [Leptotrombidium deliense]